MPAVTKVIFLDDKHYAEGKAEVEADEIVRVTVTRQPVHGGDAVTRRVEVYLTGSHAAELDKGLDPWFGIGHRQGSAPSGDRPVERTKGMRRGPQTGRGSPERREWRKRLRRWSDSLGLVNPDAPQYPAWKNVQGKHSYPVDLERAFELVEQGGRDKEVRELIARFQQSEAA